MMENPSQLIDQRFVRALAHPLRIAILDRMGWDKASPNTLAYQLGARLSNTAYHTRELEKLGVITLVDTAQRRGATEHFYRASPDVFIGGKQWMRVPAILRDASAGFSFDVLIGKVIDALRAGSFHRHRDSLLTWNVITVDEEGRRELKALLTDIPDGIAAIHDRSVERLRRGGKSASVVAGVVAFDSAKPSDGD